MLVRIGVVSDIHGNAEALDLALARMGDVDEILCTGDASDQASFSDDVTRRLREVGARFVRGNHDDALLYGFRPRPVRGDPALMQWTREQPATISTLVHGKRVLIFHATPWQELQYIFPGSDAYKRLGDQDADLIIYGHTHYRHVGSIGTTRVVNAGSTGQPRDPQHPRMDSFAIVDLPSGDVELFDFPDPVLARGELL
jgi:putative phosphoesterase